MTNDSMKIKKYILKPGRHQFAPGSPAVHHNDNLNDAEAEWYIEKYPHIKDLFEINFEDESVKSNLKSVQSPTNEDLPTTN